MALAAEVTKIICVADSSSSLQSKYFTISGMGTDFEQNDYYVWIDVGSGGTDPDISGTGIEVDIAADASAATVATAVNTALDDHSSNDFGSSRSTATLTVTNAVRGSVSDAANVNAGFTITTETEGTGTKESNHKHPEDDIVWFMQGDNLAISTTKGTDSTSVHSKLGDLKAIDESVIEGILLHYYAEPTAVSAIDGTLDLDNSLHLFVVDYVKSRLFMDKAAQSTDAAIVSSSLNLSNTHERSWKDALVKFGTRKREKVGGSRIVRPFDFR
jgi:hypothetical protein